MNDAEYNRRRPVALRYGLRDHHIEQIGGDTDDEIDDAAYELAVSSGVRAFDPTRASAVPADKPQPTAFDAGIGVATNPEPSDALELHRKWTGG